MGYTSINANMAEPTAATTNSSTITFADAHNLYPKGLEPDHEELIPGLEVTVPSINLVFKRWRGKPIKDDFGGKPVVDCEGRPMFAEIAIVRMAVKAGWSAFWQQAYPRRQNGPQYYADWKEDAVRKNQATTSSLNSSYHQDLQTRIARYNSNSYRGCWDIIAWNGEGSRTLYIETKQFKTDSIRDNQVRWFSACLSAGLKKRENFLIVKWQFEDHHNWIMLGVWSRAYYRQVSEIMSLSLMIHCHKKILHLSICIPYSKGRHCKDRARPYER